MRKRLRDYPSSEELAKLYAEPHNYLNWDDHVVRINMSLAMMLSFNWPSAVTVADLSCGTGYLASEVAAVYNGRAYLGDYAAPNDETKGKQDFVGPIEKTLAELIYELAGNRVNLFICSETLEHLCAPDLILSEIAKVAEILFLSTPDGEMDDSNPEHIWGWDGAELQRMLFATGWKPMVYNSLDLRPAGFQYCYQMWMCRNEKA